MDQQDRKEQFQATSSERKPHLEERTGQNEALRESSNSFHVSNAWLSSSLLRLGSGCSGKHKIFLSLFWGREKAESAALAYTTGELCLDQNTLESLDFLIGHH